MALRVALVAVGLGLWFLTQSLLRYLPVPEGMIWRAPGVPFLLVTYGTTNDLSFPATRRRPFTARLCLGNGEDRRGPSAVS
jgi:hypothetical protein